MYGLATTMIRMDHMQVTSLFRQYSFDAPAGVKQAICVAVCTSLEVHAQLEEEIFYPALREAGIDTDVVDKSVPEHDRMRSHIERLRETAPESSDYDDAFMALMREVLHHVADEETTVLPHAEERLAGRLAELGGRMALRRMQLMGPRSMELVGAALSAGMSSLSGGGWVGAYARPAPGEGVRRL